VSDPNPWPPMPAPGAVVADLETLRRYVGAKSTVDDVLLQERLDSATEYVYERTMECRWGHPDVQEAILLFASRLYKRRQSPEGVGGFTGEGIVVRLPGDDPDIRRLMDRHLDLGNVGVG
jgi:hypothetical protein